MKFIDKLLFLYYLLPAIYIETKLELFNRDYAKYWVYFMLLYPIFLIGKLFLKKNLLKLLILFNFISFISNCIFYYLIEASDNYETFRRFVAVVYPETYFLIFSILYFLFQCIIFYLFNKYVKKLIIKIKEVKWFNRW